MKTMRETWEARIQTTVGEGYIRQCIDDFDDACTPRPPKPDWFGTGEGQWDAWWIQCDGVATTLTGIHYHCSMHTILWLDRGEAGTAFGNVRACVPVAREGFPAPVGWQVVERNAGK